MSAFIDGTIRRVKSVTDISFISLDGGRIRHDDWPNESEGTAMKDPADDIVQVGNALVDGIETLARRLIAAGDPDALSIARKCMADYQSLIRCVSIQHQLAVAAMVSAESAMVRMIPSASGGTNE